MAAKTLYITVYKQNGFIVYVFCGIAGHPGSNLNFWYKSLFMLTVHEIDIIRFEVGFIVMI